MSMVVRYLDGNGAWSEDLGPAAIRLGGVTGFAHSAVRGTSASSIVVMDDPGSSLGHSGDEIRGHKVLRIDENACPANNRVMYYGLITPREYYREGSLITGVQRKIAVSTQDINTILSFIEIRDTTGNRSEESAADRLAWLIAGDYYPIPLADTGYVDYPHFLMPKADYRGQKPIQVLEDIASHGNFNFWVDYSEASATAFLWFRNSDRSSTYASTLRLSNINSDIDSTLSGGVGATSTFKCGPARLTRDPIDVDSEVTVQHRRGSVTVTDAATEAKFIRRSGTVNNSNLIGVSAAQRVGRNHLAAHDEETDSIATSVELPAANVNDIRGGMLISARFEEFPLYASFSYFRVRERTVRQIKETDASWVLDLRLDPAHPFSCATATDMNAAHGTVTAGVEVTSGTVTWAFCAISGWFGAPVDQPVSNVPVRNPTYANDGNDATYSEAPPEVFRSIGTGSVALNWQSDLGAEYQICSMRGGNQVATSFWRGRVPSAIQYSSDGVSWTDAPFDVHYEGSVPQWWVCTLRTETTARYWRIRYYWTGSNLWAWNSLGTRVWTWKIMGG